MKLKCSGGPADGKEYEASETAETLSILCRADALRLWLTDSGLYAAQFKTAVYRKENGRLVFDGFQNDAGEEGKLVFERTKSSNAYSTYCWVRDRYGRLHSLTKDESEELDRNLAAVTEPTT